MNTNILSFNKCKLDTMWPINGLSYELKSSRENIWTIIIHHISKKIFSSIFNISHIKKNSIYKNVQGLQKLINQFLNQVEYLI